MAQSGTNSSLPPLPRPNPSPSSLGIRQLGLLASPSTSPSPTPPIDYVHLVHHLYAPSIYTITTNVALSSALTTWLRQSQAKPAAAHAHSTVSSDRRRFAFFQAAFRSRNTADLPARSLNVQSDTPHPLDICLASSWPSSSIRRPPCAQRS
jgi:hypothetical protein